MSTDATAKIRESDIRGLKHFTKMRKLLSSLHESGCHRDKANHRSLHFDEYCLGVLLYLFNPAITSLRAIQQASQLRNVQKKLGIKRASLGSLSESVSVFDPEPLKQIAADLARQIPGQVAGDFSQVNQTITAVDGSVFDTVARVAELSWVPLSGGGHKHAFRLHTPHNSGDSLAKLSVSPDDAIIVAQGLTSDNQTGTSARWLRGYDATDGALLWQIDLPDENGIGTTFPGFDVAFTPDSRTAYVTTSYFATAGDYGYLYAIDIGDVIYGDVNQDGVVNLLDVAPFVERISTGSYQAEADINGDGLVNLLDVAPFVGLLGGQRLVLLSLLENTCGLA